MKYKVQENDKVLYFHEETMTNSQEM